jgi:DNA-binding NarL/FixJ family response regulator
MSHPRDLITERQIEILDLAATGLGLRAITRSLGLTSTKCVRQQLDRIIWKLGATDIPGAVDSAVLRGYLEKR